MKKIQIGHHVSGYKYKHPMMYASVDDEDYDRLNAVRWSAYYNKWTKTFYARRCIEKDGKTTTEWLARAVLDAPEGVLVDHTNRDTLDNRKCNLRLASQRQNQTNRGITVASSTGYKGVYRDRRGQKYLAKITVDGVPKYIGSFSTPERAARAFDKAALRYHGEYAYLNFPSVTMDRNTPRGRVGFRQ